MGLRVFVSVLLMGASLAIAQTPTKIDCNRNPSLCEIELAGENLALGMPKDRVLSLLAKHAQVNEVSAWNAEHKPDSMWTVTDPKYAIEGGVKFRSDKLDGVMVLWTPDSNETSDLGYSLINLLERFSKEGSIHCTLTTTKTAQPKQEYSDARFACGLRTISLQHTRFLSPVNGQKLPAYAAIYEMLGNW
jgi:hypothetical protein